MPPTLTEYERERQANIEKNRALLQELKLEDGPSSLGFVSINPPKGKSKASTRDGGAKPVQPKKAAGKKRKSMGGRSNKDEDDDDDDDSEEEVIIRRMPTRRGRKSAIDPNETPAQRAKREKEEEARAAREEQERLDALELAKKASQPRHHDLEFAEILEQDKSDDEDAKNKHRAALMLELGGLCNDVYPRARAEGERVKATEKERMKKEMAKMKVVARAKVTQDRVYSMAYHPEKTKDILFFGDKHGQLGIWDARAPSDEPDDDDDEEAAKTKEDGKYWRLQPHWPATSKSSISGVKFDPVDAHSVYTSAYDCTIRRTSFTTGISKEIFAFEEFLISAFDFTQNGHELWISDTKGGVTHLDMRQDRHDAQRFQLSTKEKIGCVSLNPVDNWSLLASCNDRTLKIWDTRKLMSMPAQERDEDAVDRSSPLVEPYEVDHDDVTEWMKDKNDGKPATLRGSWTHGFSVSSAYWDPSGTRILSTCYDDHLRVWDLPRKYLLPDEPLKSFRPAVSLNHDCQTGRWLTVFKAQWGQNPDVYPYFSVGDMKHSLKIISADGDMMADLKDKSKITAVQAVTATHPRVIGRAASGNASGRCVLWSVDD